MNKREDSKNKTRQLIINKSTELFINKGILNTTTAEIAKECGIAHGSIFQHFGNRENLINFILDEEIKRITLNLRNSCSLIYDIDSLLKSYIDVISAEENFLCMLYKEMPFLSDAIKRNIVALDAIIRNIFYLSINEGIIQGTLYETNVTLGLDAFFATIIRYLSLRELYSTNKGAIEAKQQDIILLFKMIFRKRC